MLGVSLSMRCNRLFCKRSNPLPPATRLEEGSQIRRCANLRRALSTGLESLLSHTFGAYQSLRPLAVEADLDKYYDIYEITRIDREDTELNVRTEVVESEEMESLKYFKTGLARLHVTRKLFLCGLLALEADGGKTDFARWPAAVETMKTLSSETSAIVATIDTILQEDGEQSLYSSGL